MRSISLGLLVGMFTAILTGQPATADDDPAINDVKLSELIAKYNALKSNDEQSNNRRSDYAQEIAEFASPKAFDFLGKILREDKSDLVRRNAALSLNHLGPKAKPMVPALIVALKDPVAGVRNDVAVALACIGPDAKTAAPDLLALLKDAAQGAEVRSSSASALSAIGADSKELVPVLKQVVQEKNLELRMACAASLYHFDKANAKLAVSIYREGMQNQEMQMSAVLGLRRFGSDAKEAIPDLITLLTKGGAGAYYAPEALKAIPEAEAALVAALKDPDPKIQKAAAAALPKAFPEAAKKAGLGKK